ncbi:MAG TPA: trypsin-like peptidase domain-containing protein [Acidimicrobiales bacterium]|nr:trypsin-like peptidase domain-containing protein [Acidimicrobiales bacterium]
MADTTTWPLPDSPPTAPPIDPQPQPPLVRAASAVDPAPADTTSRRPRSVTAVIGGLVGLVAVAGAAGGLAGARIADDGATRTPPATSASASTKPLVSASGPPAALDVGAVLAAVEGAVADIQASGPRQSGQGTGIVYSAEGLVLTNNHVVEGATTVTVTTPGDRRARAATVVGTDPDNDVAVLRLSNLDGLTVAQLGSSATTKVGEDVVAIGNALALRGDPSVTRGIVSALDRSIGDLDGLIQTDAAINSGNSGGPLVNAAGQVIGINTAIAIEHNAQNIGFAIPIDMAKAIAERLTDGTPATPTAFLGVSTMDNTAGTTGATVAEVTTGSPAAEAGVQPGDVIVALDDQAVSGAASLSRLVGSREPGTKIDLTVLRRGAERHLAAVLGQR